MKNMMRLLKHIRQSPESTEEPGESTDIKYSFTEDTVASAGSMKQRRCEGMENNFIAGILLYSTGRF